MKDLVYILAALNIFYRSAHWRSKGPSFYQDHLLFARLYENIDNEVDNLVELLIAYEGGTEFAFPRVFVENSLKYLPAGKETARENAEAALELEQKLLNQIRQISEETASVGVYNQIASIADNHTRNTYLLKQLLK
jgi:DNA-binding ferritin-like protein